MEQIYYIYIEYIMNVYVLELMNCMNIQQKEKLTDDAIFIE